MPASKIMLPLSSLIFTPSIKKTLYHAINITLTKAELFVLRSELIKWFKYWIPLIL